MNLTIPQSGNIRVKIAIFAIHIFFCCNNAAFLSTRPKKNKADPYKSPLWLIKKIATII